MKDFRKHEPKPRNPETFIEILLNVFEGETGRQLTLDELQEFPGQLSTEPLSIVFDSVEEAGLYYTTASGKAPFTIQVEIQGKNCQSVRTYTLNGLSVAEVRKLIKTTTILKLKPCQN